MTKQGSTPHTYHPPGGRHHFGQCFPMPLHWPGRGYCSPKLQLLQAQGTGCGGGSLPPHPGPGRGPQGAGSSSEAPHPDLPWGWSTHRPPHPGPDQKIRGTDELPEAQQYTHYTRRVDTAGDMLWAKDTCKWLCSRRSSLGRALGMGVPGRPLGPSRAWLTQMCVFLCALTGGKQVSWPQLPVTNVLFL